MRPRRNTLSELQLRLTPEHPDVIRLKRRITGLKQRAEAGALAAPLSPESSAPTTPAQMLQRNRERALQLELESLDRQIANKRAEEQRLRKLAARYQARIEAVPARETELTELMRDHETLQKMYTRSAGEERRVEDRRQSRTAADRRAVQDSRFGASGGKAVQPESRRKSICWVSSEG